jgi:hypothetical protein
MTRVTVELLMTRVAVELLMTRVPVELLMTRMPVKLLIKQRCHNCGGTVEWNQIRKLSRIVSRKGPCCGLIDDGIPTCSV